MLNVQTRLILYYSLPDFEHFSHEANMQLCTGEQQRQVIPSFKSVPNMENRYTRVALENVTRKLSLSAHVTYSYSWAQTQCELCELLENTGYMTMNNFLNSRELKYMSVMSAFATKHFKVKSKWLLQPTDNVTASRTYCRKWHHLSHFCPW